MTETLLTPQRCFKIGRERALHGYSVHVVGDDTVGYSVEVRTKCGRVITGDETAVNVEGFVSCRDCEGGE